MLDYLHGPVQHDAFFRKYASKKFLKGRSPCSTFYLPVTDKNLSFDRDKDVGEKVHPNLPWQQLHRLTVVAMSNTNHSRRQRTATKSPLSQTIHLPKPPILFLSARSKFG